jgi:negative regulator of sigma E activity
MNTTKLSLVLATLALSLGATAASAAQLDIDTLVYKAAPAASTAPRMAFTGKIQSNIDTLVYKHSPISSKTRAEVRQELAIAPRASGLNL